MREIEIRQGVQPQEFTLSIPSETVFPNRVTLKETSIDEGWAKDVHNEAILDRKLEAAFQKDLQSSRVYRRALKNVDQMTLISGATRATPWSILSGLSMADVSAVSVIALPIFSSEIINSQQYDFANISNDGVNTAITFNLKAECHQQWRTVKEGPFDTRTQSDIEWLGYVYHSGQHHLEKPLPPLTGQSIFEVCKTLHKEGLWST